jgi:hypothetical protein
MMNPPIIILGAPRSGTTILGEILSQHSELHYMIEPNLTWHRYAGSDSDYFDMRRMGNATEPTRVQFEAELLRSGKARLLEKTPQNCLRVPFVRSVFPDAKFIHIIRDGVESSLSIAKYWQTNTHGLGGVRLSQRLKEVSLRQLPRYGVQFLKRMLPAGDTPRVFWGPVLPGMSGIVKALSIHEVAALQWRNCVEQATLYGRSLPDDQYMELRLEDFNEQALLNILDFAQLTPEDSVVNAAKERFQSEQTSHRSGEANANEIESVMRWIQPTMQWLGQLDSRG